MRKTNQHFKLLFFTINLHFVTSDQVSTHRKQSLPLIKHYLFNPVVFSLQMQKNIQTDQSY